MRIEFQIPAFAVPAALLSLALIGCNGPTVARVASSPLAEPAVVMAANPQPPFTYWAPEGSTIRNHPTQSGIWIAEAKDGGRKYYFGDRCRASEHQHYVGGTVDALPEKLADSTWRMACSTCAVTSDLHWTRMNISFDQETRVIAEISCG